MKLHLPSSLRKALMACLAALTLPTLSVTVGSGVFASAALISLFSASSAWAVFNPGFSDWDNEETNIGLDPLNYTETEDYAGANRTLNVDVSAVSDPNVGELYRTITLNQGASESGATSSLKFVLHKTTAAPATADVRLAGTINATKVWLTGSTAVDQGEQARVLVSTGVLGTGIEDLYINNLNVRIDGWYGYENGRNLNANFHLGNGVRSTTWSNGNWDNASLNLTNSLYTTGGLEVQEDTKIVLEQANIALSFGGQLTGSGTLTLRKNINTHTGTYVRFLGGANYTGKLELINGIDVELGGGDYVIGGLVTQDNLAGTTVSHDVNYPSAKLILNVVDEAVYNGAFATENIPSITLVKRGVGKQVFSGASNLSIGLGGLEIEAGKVEISTTGEKQLGPVSISSGAELVIKTNAKLGNANASLVHGRGTLVVDGVSVVSNEFSQAFLNQVTTTTVATENNTIGLVLVRNGGVYRVEASGNDAVNRMRSVNSVRVEAGSSMTWGANAVLTTNRDNVQTLYLAGSGSGAANATGALWVWSTNSAIFSLPWNITLEGNEPVVVGNVRELRLTGAFNGAGRTMEKKGAERLVLTGTFNTTAGSSGAIHLKEGGLVLEYSSQEALKNYGIILDGNGYASGGQTYGLQLGKDANNNDAAPSSYTIGWMEGASTALNPVFSANASVLQTLVLDSASGTHDASFGISNNSVSLTKKGSYSQSFASFRGAHLAVEGGKLIIHGNVDNTSRAGSTVTVTNSGASLEVDGTLRTSGAVSVNMGSMTLGAGSSLIGSSMTVMRGTVTAGTAGSADATLTVTDDVNLSRGTSMTVNGRLAVMDANVHLADSSELTVNSVSTKLLDLQSNSRLNIAGAMTSVETNVTLGGSSSINMTGSGTQPVAFGTLTVQGSENNRITWGKGTQQSLSFTRLTGEGNVNVAEITSTSISNFQRLMIGSVTNFNGTLTGVGVNSETAGSRNTFGIFIGQVSQSTGYKGAVDVGGFGAMSDDFRKLGQGDFSLNKLTISNGGVLYMKYSGSLSIGSAFDGLHLSGATTLYYTSDDSYLTLRADEIIQGRLRITLNIDEIAVNALQEGYYLGIDGVSSSENLIQLKNLMTVAGGQLSNRDWTLEWRGNKLYLTVTRILEDQNSPWDPNWGAREYGMAPKEDELDIYKYSGSGVLAMNDSSYDEVSRTLIKIVGGGSDDSVVMGGYLYEKNDLDIEGWVDQDTYIYYSGEEDTHYHLLVGASSAVSSGSSEGGYLGRSHVQIESGSVDYIVGGNHVTNSAFTFRGNSYIAVMGGSVNGGVVGGSTLTGIVQSSLNPYAFLGNTYVNVYTVLGNDHTPGGDLPGITLSPGETGNVGAAFTAIVGANAWVGAGRVADSAKASFLGSSEITIDLTNYGKDAERGAVLPHDFEKAVVGGNYVSSEAGSLLNDIFEEGHAWIKISSGNDINFLGTINGANRVQGVPGATGKSEFTGVAVITISGGAYSDTVAGGFMLDGVADGHTAVMSGSSTVELHSGIFRGVVAGGSYARSAGGAIEHQGDSLVSVLGGDYEGAAIVGGSYATGFSGASVRTGNTKVDLVSGDFESSAVVGGDRIEFNGAGSSVINGNSSVNVSSGTELTGGINVVGGASISGTGGSLTINGASGLSITGATVGSADDAQTQPVLVGGSYLGGDSNSNLAVHTDQTGLQVRNSNVYANLIGGHYAGASGSGYHVSVGSTGVEVSGNSTVVGSIFGGHYLAGEASMDAVGEDAVKPNFSVTVSGASHVVGNIYGGSYLSDSADNAQGDIVVSLQGGSLKGNVYAAGKLSGGATGSAESATVELHADFDFDVSDIGSEIVVSGGYEGAVGAGSVVTSRLRLTSDKQYGEQVNFMDFNEVEVVPTLEVSIDSRSGLEVMGDVFTKTGAGKLVIVNGLSAGDHSGNPYTGGIVVRGGELVLGVDQAMDGGLTFDLNGRVSNNSTNAYLQAGEGVKLTKGAADIVLKLEMESEAKLRLGSYYLASGLADGIGVDDFSLEGGEDAWNAWKAAHVESDYNIELKLKSGKLYLQVREQPSEKWIWGGDSDGSTSLASGQWSNNSADNWNTTQTGTPSAADVYFTASGADVNDGEVTLVGTVSPMNVHVEGGSYKFVQDDTPAARGLELGTEPLTNGMGNIVIGGAGYEASLELALANSRINAVVLRELGTLTLSHAKALPQNTKISFEGGVLGYGMDENNSVIVIRDMSGLVDAATSTDIVKICVGTPGNDYGVGTPDVGSGDMGADYAVWGNATATRAGNSGVKLALDGGIEKSGHGSLLVEWAERLSRPADGSQPVAVVGGSITAYEGVLQYLVHASTGSRVRIGGEGTDSPDILVGETGTLVFAITGESVSLDIRDSFKSITTGGMVEIGTRDNADLSFSQPTNAPYLMWGDNSAFSGTIRLVGSGLKSVENTVWVNSAAALGGKTTTLELAGRHLMLGGSADTVEVNVVRVTDVNYLGGYEASLTAQTNNTSITMKAASLEGDGVLANAGARSATLKFDHIIESDNITGFMGTLVAGEGSPTPTGESTWRLRGTRAGADSVDEYTGMINQGNMLVATLAGNGRIIFEYAENVVLTGTVGDTTWGAQTSLENDGAADLVLALGEYAAQSTGTLITHADKGVIRLGFVDANNEDRTGYWKGTKLSGDGAFVLTSGTLLNAITSKGDAKLNVHTQTRVLDPDLQTLAGTVVDAGGTLGSMFDDIFVNANGLLKNVNGDINLGAGGTRLTLRFGEDNYGTTVAPLPGRSAMIELNDGNINVLDMGDKKNPSLVLDFTEETFFGLLQNQIVEDNTTYLYVMTGGELNLDKSLWYDVVYSGGDYLRLLVYLGLEISGTPSGTIALTGHLQDVYLVDGMHEEFKDTVEGYGQLSKFKATVVGKDLSLDFTLTGEALPENGADAEEMAAGGGVIHNLVGLENSRLGLHNGGDFPEEQRVTVVIDNHEYSELEGEVRGINTTFKGTITADAGVDIKKTGSGTLTIGSSETGNGGLRAAGDVTLTEGMIVLQGGQSNRIEQLEFDYDTTPATDEERGLRLTNGTKTSIGLIAENSDRNRRDVDNVIYVVESAELTIDGSSNTLASTCIIGDGTGTLHVGRDSLLTLGNANAKQLDNVALDIVTDATLDLGATTMSEVTALGGKGALMGREGSALTITSNTGAVFSGELAGDGRGTGGGVLNVGTKGALNLDNVLTSAGAAWSIASDGDLRIDVSASKRKTYFQDITLGRGSRTTYVLDTDYADSMFSATSFTVEGSAELIIESTGHGELNVVNGRVTLAEVGSSEGEATLTKLDVTLKGVPFLHYDAGSLSIRDGKLQLAMNETKENRFVLPDMEKNAYAGARLFWAASGPSSTAWENMVNNPNSDLYKITGALAEMYYDGDTAGMSRTLAAGAGASISVLGSAVAHDVQRQLAAIRNRTTTMNSEPTHDVYDRAERIYHVWMNGEGSYFKTDADGLAPGYSLNSWGGTVGIDTDLNRQTTVGVALTGMYGDLRPNSVDQATGSLDTTYLTGFARIASGAWMHTFIVAGGMADVELSRTVSHPYGSYATHSDTTGFSFAALYELGYARVMNAEGTFIIQSVVNVQLSHVMLNGFTESGSDAALRVDDIRHDVVTFGAGARAQAIVGENLYNRTSILEGRLLVKLDAGDRSGTSTHALVNGTADKAELESAKVGPVGVELGAGISIPLGSSSGTIFFDASLELRRGYTSVDANLGYRFSF